mgnify:CR=1 FL=1
MESQIQKIANRKTRQHNQKLWKKRMDREVCKSLWMPGAMVQAITERVDNVSQFIREAITKELRLRSVKEDTCPVCGRKRGI